MKREYEGHDFIDRKVPIPEEILAKVPPLDQLLYIPDYKEVKDAFLGGAASKSGSEELKKDSEFEEGSSYEAPEPSTELKDSEEQPTSSNKCPIGVIFGDDFDNFEDCDGCAVRLECKAVKEAPKDVPKPRRRKG
jgi:hypothetical protein